MEFVELPDHINCSFVGSYSPVLIRFEGGNGKSSFCVEEYHGHPPLVKIYGDQDDAKNQMKDRLGQLNWYLNQKGQEERPFKEVYHATSLPRDAWFVLEVRSTSESNFRIDGYHFAITTNKDLRDLIMTEARLAYQRMLSLYQRFYNV